MTTISTPAGTQGLVFEEPLLLDQSAPGRGGYEVKTQAVEDVEPAEVLPRWALRDGPAELPEVSEPEVARHFTRLSQWNFSIDHGMYPLGSCTMKYNPRFNEAMARLEGFAALHPHTPERHAQGALELMKALEDLLARITGLHAVSLQPSAGAQGEFVGVQMIRARHLDCHGTPRKTVLIPESAHGTNPASCTLAGYDIVSVPAGDRGILEVARIERLMNDDVAALMLTNPNTLGLFETHIVEIAEIVHRRGGLVYMDGANMNALLGHALPGEMGVDVMHLNLHKTFSTPHGGGGPGAGPVAVVEELEPYLPTPVIARRDGAFVLDDERPKSIGRVRSFYGNFGMFVRAYAYIRALGPDGLKRIADVAVLNANYIREGLKGAYHLPFDVPCMHEVVFNDKLQQAHGIKTLDIAKRLMDYGYHPPTVYFPLVVAGALMIEPTESETRRSLDQFIAAMRSIADEAKENPELLKTAPHNTFRRRLDEVRAARHLNLRWRKPAIADDEDEKGGRS